MKHDTRRGRQFLNKVQDVNVDGGRHKDRNVLSPLVSYSDLKMGTLASNLHGAIGSLLNPAGPVSVKWDRLIKKV